MTNTPFQLPDENEFQNELPRYLHELTEWLAIPSISADPAYKQDVRVAAQWLVDHLHSLGAEQIILHETDGHPIVTARVGNDATKPTILVYGHYDVQPADPVELWDTPAFSANVRDGKIYARGTSDDKGQVFLHLKALEWLKKQNHLPCNIVFLIEGEEECGSIHLPKFIQQNKELLKCDVVLVSDTTIVASDIPSLTVGLRGLSYIEVTLTGPNRDLHSGLYGGAVDNPIHALARMIAQLHDDQGRITIPNFYDDMKEYDTEARRLINQSPHNDQEYMDELGIKALTGEKGYTVLEKTGIRPCLDVNGIWGGYIHDGRKTVLPSKAHAKISMRLTAYQDHHKAAQQLMGHLQSLKPDTMKIEVRDLGGGPYALTSVESKAYAAAEKAFLQVWNKNPVPVYSGGSIPIVSVLNENLKADVVLMGFGLESDAIHSPNEHFVISHIPKGIAAIIAFHKFFATPE